LRSRRPDRTAPPLRRALRLQALTPLYDWLCATCFREASRKGRLVAQLEAEERGRILDLGCGTGTLLPMIADRAPGAVALGIDIDLDVLAVARRKLRQRGLAVRLAAARAETLPFASGSFAAVTSSLMLHHLNGEQKRRGLAEVRRVLRRDGRFHLLDFAAVGSPLARLLLSPWRLFDGFENTRDNVYGTLPLLVERAGLGPVRLLWREWSLFGPLEWRVCGPAGPGRRRPRSLRCGSAASADLRAGAAGLRVLVRAPQQEVPAGVAWHSRHDSAQRLISAVRWCGVGPAPANTRPIPSLTPYPSTGSILCLR